MKNIIATAALLLMAATTTITAQTKRVMTVVQKDGTQVVYKVNSVERVTFTDMELPSLRNQIAYDDNIADIDQATLLAKGGRYVVTLSVPEIDITSDATGQDISSLAISLPKDSMGQQLTLTADSGSAVAVYYNGEPVAVNGTLQVRFGRSGTIAVTLESETDHYLDLRCHYAGTYAEQYQGDNIITVAKGETLSQAAVASAFTVKPATTGAATLFAFGDAEVSVSDSLAYGTKAVVLGVSALKLYGDTIDMAADPDSYSFQYIDYEKREAYDKVTAGKIVTRQDAAGNVYVNIVATLDDGRQVTVDYYGPVTEADTLGNIIPQAVADNQYKYYNSDGDLSVDRQLGTSYIKAKSGNTTFYLVPEGESKSSSYRVQLQVSDDLINAGELDLANLGQTAIFSLRFDLGGIQLTSYASGHGYGNTPDNGTMTITKSDDDVYDIQLDVYNHYVGPWSTGGDNTHLVLHYTGTFEQY